MRMTRVPSASAGGVSSARREAARREEQGPVTQSFEAGHGRVEYAAGFQGSPRGDARTGEVVVDPCELALGARLLGVVFRAVQPLLRLVMVAGEEACDAGEPGDEQAPTDHEAAPARVSVCEHLDAFAASAGCSSESASSTFDAAGPSDIKSAGVPTRGAVATGAAPRSSCLRPRRPPSRDPAIGRPSGDPRVATRRAPARSHRVAQKRARVTIAGHKMPAPPNGLERRTALAASVASRSAAPSFPCATASRSVGRPRARIRPTNRVRGRAAPWRGGCLRHVELPETPHHHGLAAQRPSFDQGIGRAPRHSSQLVKNALAASKSSAPKRSRPLANSIRARIDGSSMSSAMSWATSAWARDSSNRRLSNANSDSRT